MPTTLAAPAMTGQEIVDLTKKHTLFEWSAQSKVDPIPVARSKGIYFWTPEGKRFIDFNSQLMCVNIGHGDPRVVRAIQEQVEVLDRAHDARIAVADVHAHQLAVEVDEALAFRRPEVDALRSRHRNRIDFRLRRPLEE